MDGNGTLLGISRAEVYHQFGAPSAGFGSVLVYAREEKIMVLVFGISDRNGLAEELTRGYIYGTIKDGVLECGGVNLLDMEDVPKPGDPFTVELKNCVAADVGSTFYRPALFSKDLTFWQLVLSGTGVIDDVIKVTMKDLLEGKRQTKSITREQADLFYEKMFEKEE